MNINDSEIDLSSLRVAIVHYWFVGRAGGERVVEAITELFPQAQLFSLIAEPDTMAPDLRRRTLHTSFLQHMPFVRKFYRQFLFLQPLALEQFDLSGYDLVISSESGPAKGVITSPSTCHICYCHSPMRYIWEMYPRYRQAMNPLLVPFFGLVANYMRLWDLASASRVDCFVANSRFIADRIGKHYRRKSTVIHPPVDVNEGSIRGIKGDYYLAVGRLVDYKRFDLAIAACSQLGKPLRVIGDGPEYRKLTKIAGPTIQFLGRADDHHLREQLAGCKALIFPGEEDFGIIPVEAQSFGKPVIAFSSGGALETIRGGVAGSPQPDNPTGLFFRTQSTECLIEAILAFEQLEDTFDAEVIRRHSMQFDKAVFQQKFSDFVQLALADMNRRREPLPAYDDLLSS